MLRGQINSIDSTLCSQSKGTVFLLLFCFIIFSLRKPTTGPVEISKLKRLNEPFHVLNILIKNSEFKNISCEKNGGSLYFDLVENVEISNSTFTHSYAEFGGAILQLEGSLTVENCNFTQNTAFYDGGAIYASYVNLKLNNKK